MCMPFIPRPPLEVHLFPSIHSCSGRAEFFLQLITHKDAILRQFTPTSLKKNSCLLLSLNRNFYVNSSPLIFNSNSVTLRWQTYIILIISGYKSSRYLSSNLIGENEFLKLNIASLFLWITIKIQGKCYFRS